MVGLEASSSHFVTLKSWSNSAEYNRIKMRHLVDFNPDGYYRVRMAGSSKWIDCDIPPITGAAEWLYFNNRAVPLFYWSIEKESIFLI